MVATALAGHVRHPTPEQLVELHVGFARSLVRKFASRLPISVDQDQLESDAYLGLMLSARSFDPSRGVQFQTYAAKRIWGQMLDGLRENTQFRRRIPLPKIMSLQAVIRQDDDRSVTLGDTVAADTKPVGYEAETMDEVNSILRRLDVASRKHLTDRHVEGLQQKVLAHRLGITPSAMSERMKRVRKLVQEIHHDRN